MVRSTSLGRMSLTTVSTSGSSGMAPIIPPAAVKHEAAGVARQAATMRP
jgi:hypothetical protein